MWDMSQHPQINVAPNSPAPPVQSLPPSIRLKPDNPSSQSPARAVRFNPRNAMMAVGGESLVCTIFPLHDIVWLIASVILVTREGRQGRGWVLDAIRTIAFIPHIQVA